MNLELLEFSYLPSCLVEESEILKYKKDLDSEIQKINSILDQNYNSIYASLDLLQDSSLINSVDSLVKQKKLLNPKLLVIIGIGGSNLGAQAVFQAIKGMFYNDLNYNNLKVYFADTISPEYTDSL